MTLRRLVLIGTAGLLLRSRQYLPDLSPELGRHLSGNGDLALLATLPRSRRLPGRGRVRQYQGVAMDTVCYEWLRSHGFVIITQHQLSLATVPNGAPVGSWWGLEKKRQMLRYGDQMLGLAVIGIDGSPGTVQAGPTGGEVQLTPAFGVSGMDFPIDPETLEVVSGGIVEQTERALANLQAVLEARAPASKRH